MGGNRCAFPDGESRIAPVKDTSEGTLLFNTCMHRIGRLINPITIKVLNGRVVEIDREQEATKLRIYCKKNGGDHALNCSAEISIGLNPHLPFTGVIRTDKEVYVSVHVAFRSNFDIGGKVKSSLHLGGVIVAPELLIDGKKVLASGRLLIWVEFKVKRRISYE